MIDEKIKKQALELSKQDRAELAHVLIDSLEPQKKFESEDSWSKELKERIDRYERGESAARPWNEIKENARALLDQ